MSLNFSTLKLNKPFKMFFQQMKLFITHSCDIPKCKFISNSVPLQHRDLPTPILSDLASFIKLGILTPE